MYVITYSRRSSGMDLPWSLSLSQHGNLCLPTSQLLVCCFVLGINHPVQFNVKIHANAGRGSVTVNEYMYCGTYKDYILKKATRDKERHWGETQGVSDNTTA